MRQENSTSGASLERSRRHWLGGAAAAFLSAGGWSRTAHAVRVSEPETSKRVRDESAALIPFQKLTPAARGKMLPVVQKPTLFRRMPTEQIACHPALFTFLVRYPEVVVSMWRMMDATKLSVKRIGQYLLDSNDGAGTTTQVELVYGTSNMHLLYADGTYSGPLFRRELQGQCVLVVHSDFQKNNRGEDIVTCTLDVFIAVKNAGVDLMARTIHPLIGKTADHNFAESARFVSQISEQAAKNPAGMQRLSERLPHVAPEVRRKFAEQVRDSVAETQTAPATTESAAATAATPRGAAPVAQRR
ncbi:MAG: hypothetical protein KDB14_20620 [Planctomycetales bacterium]|nr:hypothetical protein [Planctomycetales bacterium]